MKIAALLRRGQPLDRSAAWLCVVTNQLVTPGLGSIVAGRFWAGLIQLALALAGCVLLVLWFFHLLKVELQGEDLAAGLHPYAWLGEVGLALFLSGWLLALSSSVGSLRQARANETNTAPPRI